MPDDQRNPSPDPEVEAESRDDAETEGHMLTPSAITEQLVAEDTGRRIRQAEQHRTERVNRPSLRERLFKSD